MNNGFDNDFDNRLITAGNEEEVDFEPETAAQDTESDEYYELPLAIKSRSLIWSVVSFTLGILSLALCFFYYLALPFAAASVVFAMVSRRNLGFFERYSIMGLVLGFMGIVFGVFCLVAKTIGII